MGFIDDKRTITESSGEIKPRRTKGTYSFKFRNYFATGIIGVGIVFGAIWMILPNTNKIRAQMLENLKDREEEKLTKARLMSSFGPQLTSEGIQKVLENDTYAKKP